MTVQIYEGTDLWQYRSMTVQIYDSLQLFVETMVMLSWKYRKKGYEFKDVLFYVTLQ